MLSLFDLTFPIVDATELYDIRISEFNKLLGRLLAAVTASAIYQNQLILIGELGYFIRADAFVTKSVSRFARNTVDSLMWTRKLRAKGIGVYFEEQAIDSPKAENEMLIGLFSVIAQSESEKISANVKWGVQQRMKNGSYRTNFDCFGYRKGENGIPSVVPEEAEAVKRIYQMFLDGYSLTQIARYLTESPYKTYRGHDFWKKEEVRYILTNEKYVGDIILQKTFISNCIDKQIKLNRGELPKYLVSNNHPGIIDRDTFNVVQVEFANRSNKKSKSNLAQTEKGRYSSKFALTDILICGCCGSHYRRTGKTDKNGKRLYYWRCINRMDSKAKVCYDSIGVEENKLQRLIFFPGTRAVISVTYILRTITSDTKFSCHIHTFFQNDSCTEKSLLYRVLGK